MKELLLRGVLVTSLSASPFINSNATEFIDGSHLKLQLRNVYFNENFRDENGLSPRAAKNAKSGLKVFYWTSSPGLHRARLVLV